MKKYIRDMINDLQGKNHQDRIPPVPAPAPAAKTTHLDQPPAPPVEGDLANQVLSEDPLERTRQLDFQAQRKEEGQG